MAAAVAAAEEKSLYEHTGWSHVWSGSQWKRYFLLLTPGILRTFYCDRMIKIKGTLKLEGCRAEVQGPFCSEKQGHASSQKISKQRSSSDVRLWKKMSKLTTTDSSFCLADAAIVIIEPLRGKRYSLLFPRQKEAEVWKVAIKEAAVLGSPNSLKKENAGSLKGSARLEQKTELNPARDLIRMSSFLRRPFGLKWEAYPPPHNQGSVVTNPADANLIFHTGDKFVAAIKQIHSDPLWHDLETTQGCLDFLRSSCYNVNALDHAASMVDHFKGSYQMGDSSLPDELRLEAWKGTLRRVVKTLVEQLLENNPSLDSCMVNEEHMDQLWIACEVWVFGAVYDKIMGTCKQMCAVNDSLLDHTLAKLQKVDPLKLGVRAEFEDFILGEAFQQFRMLNRLRTPYEKALCLRKTVSCIVEGIQSLIASCTGALRDTDGLLPTTDDLLSFMLLLMARGKVKNLQANACYMENFLNLHKEDCSHGELAYHITNFAAACNYLQAPAIQELVVNVVLSPVPTKINPPSTQYQNLSDDLSYCSQASFKSNYSFSNSSVSSSQKIASCFISDSSYSLESDADSRYRELNHKESSLEEHTCFDDRAFSNWKLNNGMSATCSSLERARSTVILDDEGDVCLVSGWSNHDSPRESDEQHCLPRFISFLDESPNFILAPTYL